MFILRNENLDYIKLTEMFYTNRSIKWIFYVYMLKPWFVGYLITLRATVEKEFSFWYKEALEFE